MASLVYMTTLASGRTLDEPEDGKNDSTLGRAVSTATAVVNTLAKSVSALPVRSSTSAVTITATTLAAGRLAVSVTVRLSDDRATDGRTTLPFTNSTNVSLFTVVEFNDSENVSAIGVFGPISTAPSFGVIDVSCGFTTSVAVPVVNVRVTPTTTLPARSVTAVVTDTVMLLFPGNGAVGVNVTTLPFTASSPATSPDKPDTVICVPLANVVTSTGSLNVIVTVVSGDTFVAPCAGTTVTVGRTVSAVALAEVLKLLVTPLSELPARSHSPFSVTVYCVEVANAACGVKVTCVPSVLSASVPPTGTPPALTSRSARSSTAPPASGRTGRSAGRSPGSPSHRSPRSAASAAAGSSQPSYPS